MLPKISSSTPAVSTNAQNVVSLAVSSIISFALYYAFYYASLAYVIVYAFVLLDLLYYAVYPHSSKPDGFRALTPRMSGKLSFDDTDMDISPGVASDST